MNDLIIDKLPEIKQSQNNVKLEELEYATKIGEKMVLVNTYLSLPIAIFVYLNN